MIRSRFPLILALAVLSFGAIARAGDALPLETCVVNGDKFSEHHAPIMVTYKGRSMFVCCKGCKHKFDKDPEKYLKLWEEALKAQKVKAAK